MNSLIISSLLMGKGLTTIRHIGLGVLTSLVCSCHLILPFGRSGSDARSDGTLDRTGDGAVGGMWVTLPKAPSFTMGSPTAEPCRNLLNPETAHQVTLTRASEMQTTEVTWGQFQTLMRYKPPDVIGCGASCPAECMECPVEWASWHDAAAYCNALSAAAGKAPCYECAGSQVSLTCSEVLAYSGQAVYNCPGYRLPTEAEWEHAYRAGTDTAFYNGPVTSCEVDERANKIGWYAANSQGTSQPVGQKQPNAWGLYDMAGNAWEWCHDRYQNDLGTLSVEDPVGSEDRLVDARVLRGGMYYGGARYLRAAMRLDRPSRGGGKGVGFRGARTITP